MYNTAESSAECQRWNQRYANEPLFVGNAPNPYLVTEVAKRFQSSSAQPAKALCLGEGEGRDALFLARRGFDVTAVDGSEHGLNKLIQQARLERLTVETVMADLARYTPQLATFDLVTSFYCHLPPALRIRVNGLAVNALKPGGTFLLEGFTPRQHDLGLTSGGPPEISWLFEPADLRRELEDTAEAGFTIESLQAFVINLNNGRHHGPAAIMRLLGQR